MPNHNQPASGNLGQMTHDLIACGERIMRFATAGCCYEDLSIAAGQEFAKSLSISHLHVFICPPDILLPECATHISPLQRACIIEPHLDTSAAENIPTILHLLDAAARLADLPATHTPVSLLPDPVELRRYLAPAVMHDLRNVLAGIIGALELHRTQINTPDPAYLDATMQRALEGVAITNGWREVLGEYPPEHLTADCVNVCTEVVTILSTAINQIPGFEALKFNLDLTPLKILAAPAEIRRALVSLLMNAALAAPEGIIQIVVTRRNQRAIISISDNGPGMNEATRRKAKEPFYTGWGGQHWGVGLTIAEGIAKRYNGSLALRICETAGALVILSLPTRDA